MLVDYSISFPNLGLEFSHVGKSVSIFGVEIAFYGIVIAIGMLLGIGLACREAKRVGLNEDDYFTMLILSIGAGVVGARLYYVLFSWEKYKHDLWEIFNIRNGGLAIYGGILGAVLCAFIYTRIKKMRFRKVMDTMAVGVLVGQILGRWGNFFNREAFGGYTDGLLTMRLPKSAVRASDINAEISANIVDGYIQVHPTFLYESIWNLGVLAVLMMYRKHQKFDGEIVCMYLIGYGTGRLWIEGLRTDQLLMPILKLPVSQVLSAVLILLGIVGMILGRRRAAQKSV